MIKLKIIILLFVLVIPLTIYAQTLEINHLHITNITETGAMIEWETSLPCSSEIQFGEKQEELYKISMDLAVEKQHNLTLNSLRKGTIYYFRIRSNISNHQITSSVYDFKTKGIPKLKILQNEIAHLTYNDLQLIWIYNQPVKAVLNLTEKNKTLNENQIKITNTHYQEKGIFEVHNLKPSTDYKYFIYAFSQNNEQYSNQLSSFSTLEWNVALGKSVQGTFTNYLRSDPLFDSKTPMLKRVTDNKMNYFDGMAVSESVKQANQYLIIDLEKVYCLDKIKVYWRSLSVSLDYALYLSENNKDWVLLKEKINGIEGKSIRGEKGNPIILQ